MEKGTAIVTTRFSPSTVIHLSNRKECGEYDVFVAFQQFDNEVKVLIKPSFLI